MAAHIMNPGVSDAFTVLVTTETTEEELAEQVQAAQDWLLAARDMEARRVQAQEAYDRIMSGEPVEFTPEEGESQ